MIYFVRFDHADYQVVEYRPFALGTVQSVAELVKIPVHVEIAYP